MPFPNESRNGEFCFDDDESLSPNSGREPRHDNCEWLDCAVSTDDSLSRSSGLEWGRVCFSKEDDGTVRFVADDDGTPALFDGATAFNLSA